MGTAVFDLSALRRAAPGEPVIPVDSARVVVRRNSDQHTLQDTTVALAGFDSTGASATLSIGVTLQGNSEDVTVTVTAFGAGITWFSGTTTATLVANQTVNPGALTLTYTGPGANADSVRIQVTSSRLVGGVGAALTAVVYAGGSTVAGVPVGYRVGNTAVAAVSGQGLNAATLTGAVPVRDSTWVHAEIPTHLKDSTRIRVVPPPSQLLTVSGGGQSGPPGVALAAPLVVRVMDQLSGGFWGQAVGWNVTAGGATLSASTTPTDTAGYASVTVTPTLAGTVTVQATAVGLQGSPQVFSATVASAGSLSIVSGNAQSDTIGATLAPFVVRAADAQNNPLVGAQVSWVRLGGTGSLSATSTTTGTTGQTQVSYTLGAAPGADSVRATLVSTGAAVTFTTTTLAGAVRSVTLNRTRDTIPKGATLQYTATLRDAQGNVIPGSVAWSATAPGVATVNSAGLATALAGGYARIIATSGGYADTADLYVRALTTIAVRPADTVITAVGDSVRLAATALTNFGDTVSTGIVIRWISATPTVATVNAITGWVRLIGPGNAVVLARDSLSGVQGPGTVRVIQVPAAVTNTPADSIQVGIGGRGQIVARALDRNGFPIPGRTFGWTTRNATLATVDQFGVVTGVALGQTWAVDSLVDSAGVFKDSTMISVVTLPPAVVQWAYDSVAVGNGGNLQVALTLTRPNLTAPLIVKFTWPNPAVDSFLVKPSVRTVTFPANVTASSVTINGLAAGRATLIVSDSSGLGYLADTMVVTVVSTIEFREIGSFNRQPNFYVNKNETHRAQVFLSDPAPPGGLGVTFVYGAPGKSMIAPAPAIIPAGQLAADVVIQGIGQGRDSVIPTSGGFVGKFSYVYIASDSLQLSWGYPYTGVVGLGQRLDNSCVGYTYSMDHPLVVSLNLTPAIGTRPDTVTIPTGTSYRCFNVSGTTFGSATLTASAPGWVPNTLTFTVSTPRLASSGTSSIVAGNPSRGTWSAYTEDSLSWSHPVVDTVTVTAVSRNTAAVTIDVPVGKVLPGNSSVSIGNALRALPTAGGDSAWIVLTAPASGYVGDSFKVYVTRPTLDYVIGYPWDGRLGLGTRFQNAGYVQIPYARPDTLWVVLSHSRRGVLGGPDSVAILPGSTYRYFDVQGDSLGVDTVAVSRATGYVVNGGPIAYKVDSLRVYPYSYPQTLYTISAPTLMNVIVVNAVNGYTYPLLAPLTANVTSGNPAAFTLAQSTVTIPAGTYISNYDTVRVVGVDTVGARFYASAPGAAADSSAALTRVYPTPLTVQTGYPYTISQGLRLPFNYVYLTGGNAPDTVIVRLTHTNPTFTLSRDSVLILKNQSSSQSFEILANDSAGTDSIIATATNYVTSRTTLNTQPSRIDVIDFGANHLTTDAPTRVITYTETRSGYSLKPGAPVTYTIASSNPNVLVIDSAATVNAAGDTATAVVDTSRGYGYFKVRYVGSGSARIYVSAPGYDRDSTQLVNVTGPSLNLAYTTVTVGKDQVFRFQYVYVNNPVTAPLVVKLLRSDSLLPPGSQAYALAVDSAVIPLNGTASPQFNITGNAIGSAQLVARATGYSQAVSTISVGQPVLVANYQTLPLYVGERPRAVSVSTYDQALNGRPVAAALVVSSTASDPSVAAADSASRTIPALGTGTTFNVGPRRKGGGDIVWSAAGYVSDTTVVSVDTAKLSLLSPPQGLGPGQVATNQMYVSLPYSTDSVLVVTLQSTNPGVLTVPASTTIPAGGSFAYLTVTGVAGGTASVIATAPHSYPDTQAVVIGQPGLSVSLSTNTNAGQRYTFTVFSRDSLGNIRSVTSPLTVTLVSSNPGHSQFDSLTTTIQTNQSSVSMGVIFDTAGTYTVTASAAGYANGQATTTTTGALVSITDFQFGPATVTIPVNRVVTWRNLGAVTHTSTSDAGVTPAWNSGNIAVNGTYSRTFSTAGTFTYHCTVHPGMTGTVVVQ